MIYLSTCNCIKYYIENVWKIEFIDYTREHISGTWPKPKKIQTCPPPLEISN